MFQKVFNFLVSFTNRFWPSTPNIKRTRASLDCNEDDDDDDDVIELVQPKRIKMDSVKTGSSYFPGLHSSRDSGSQTEEIVDLTNSSNVMPTVTILDDPVSHSDKENSTCSISSPDKLSKDILKNKYRPPLHCRSPTKSDLLVPLTPASESALQKLSALSRRSLKSAGGAFSAINSRKSISRSHIPPKPFRSRGETLVRAAIRQNKARSNSEAVFDLTGRREYGNLLGSVLRSPELFQVRNVTKSQSISIDLTMDDEDDKGTKKKEVKEIIDQTKQKSQSESNFVDLTGEPSHSNLSSNSRNRTPKLGRRFFMKGSLPKEFELKTQKNNSVIDLTQTAIKEKSTPVLSIDLEGGEGTSSDVKKDSPKVNNSVTKRVPMNSWHMKLKHQPFMSSDYLQKLEEDIARFKSTFSLEVDRCNAEHLFLAKHSASLNDALEKRMQRHLKITEILIDEDKEEKLPFPALSDRMLEKVSEAWDKGRSSQQVLVSNFNYQIRRSDLCTLRGLNWLNDEVINFYMQLIFERGKEKDFPSVYTFNTFFYQKLVKDGQAGLKRWTRKIDIFSFEKIIIPIHLQVHWCLACINFKLKTIKYFDSMGQANQKCLQSLLQYLQDEMKDKKKQTFSTSGWILSSEEDIPQQMNSCDCGVFACTFAEYISRNAEFNFGQKEMPYFRKKMTYEILTSHLLS